MTTDPQPKSAVAPQDISEAEIDRRFDYHRPDDARARTHEQVRGACKDLALRLATVLPAGRDKSTAITKLEEVMFWANAAIARDGK
jgi:hypothetical protein